MPISSSQITVLQAIAKPAVAAYWAVTWDSSDSTQTRYYSDRGYHQAYPFQHIGHTIEARLLESPILTTQFELNPDLRTDTITITFDDIDKAISAKFQTFKSGIRAELFFYYPDVDLGLTTDDGTLSIWFGQLQAPQIYGHKTLQTVATNGFRSREQLVPKRIEPRECTANFGGLLPTRFALDSNGCIYDRHLGGVVGALDPITGLPYLGCPRLTVGDCTTRLPRPHAFEYFLGFDTDASATVTDQHSGYVAVSKGNESALKQPIRVIAGTKYMRGLELLLWRREVNNSTPAHGFVRGVWCVGEGPVEQIYNVKVKEKIIEFSQQDVKIGQPGQFRTSYASEVSNFSHTAHFMAAYGWVDALSVTVNDIPAECNVVGFRNVHVMGDLVPAGNGLVGRYYRMNSFGDPAGCRVDSNINHPSASDSPFPGVSNIGFGVVWTGYIQPRYSETYTFTFDVDDGVVVNIDGTEIINQTTPGSYTGTIALTASAMVPVTISFYNLPLTTFNPWTAVFSWQSASQALEVVPNSRLFHDEVREYTCQWTDDRVWWLFEVYTNQKWGMSNPDTRFILADFVTASEWGRDDVSFGLTFPDGETQTYAGRRTTFDASLEPRPVAEQIEDICRAGAISVPFQSEGQYTIVPFRPATSGELSSAKVFTDAGATKNIVWADGQPAIQLQQTPDDKIVNEIVLTFEEATNYDVERPITVDDPDQKLKAGRVLGENNLQSVPKRDSAFGIRNLQEVVRLGYRTLRFGQFDEGGIENNLRAIFTTPFEQALGVRRYDIIEIDSTLLDIFTIGLRYSEAPQYFRVLKMRKLANGLVEITAQAYNRSAYEAFETISTPTPPGDPPVHTPDDPPVHFPPACSLSLGVPTYNTTTGALEVPIEPC